MVSRCPTTELHPKYVSGFHFSVCALLFPSFPQNSYLKVLCKYRSWLQRITTFRSHLVFTIFYARQCLLNMMLLWQYLFKGKAWQSFFLIKNIYVTLNLNHLIKLTFYYESSGTFKITTLLFYYHSRYCRYLVLGIFFSLFLLKSEAEMKIIIQLNALTKNSLKYWTNLYT